MPLSPYALKPSTQWQAQPSAAASAIGTVLEGQAAAVRFRDLPAQDQADAGASRFRRKEWDEEIGARGQAWPLVADQHLAAVGSARPADLDTTARLE